MSKNSVLLLACHLSTLEPSRHTQNTLPGLNIGCVSSSPPSGIRNYFDVWVLSGFLLGKYTQDEIKKKIPASRSLFWLASRETHYVLSSSPLSPPMHTYFYFSIYGPNKWFTMARSPCEQIDIDCQVIYSQLANPISILILFISNYKSSNPSKSQDSSILNKCIYFFPMRTLYYYWNCNRPSIAG